MSVKRIYLLILLLGFVSSGILFENSCKTKLQEKVDKKELNQETLDVPTFNPKPQTKWVSPTLFGLKFGESTESDVKKVLGNPDSESSNLKEDKVFEKDQEEEIILDYKNPSQINGAIVIIIGKETRIVKAASFYPYEKITLEEIISKYGYSFFQIKSIKSKCDFDIQKVGLIDKSMAYPFNILYPNLGILVDIRDYNNDVRVGRIDYLFKCE